MPNSLKIQLKRVYEPKTPQDGMRILVERLWPRGVSKENAHIDAWYKELAPSPELRKWYNHQIELWDAFCERYQQELREKRDILNELYQVCQNQPVTFIYAARDTEHNSAVLLKHALESGIPFACQ